ncbi:hypothetical protein J7M02_03375 [Candidatus Aerophobetes bacterium]|nr:hypothetical protein [Candidatus Aerophobetes bacterium]
MNISKQQGKGGNPLGRGGSDYCICPRCGYKAEHNRGIPCTEMTCPKCGAKMIGQMEYEGLNKELSSQDSTSSIGTLEAISKPYASLSEVPKALRTAGLTLAQANDWIRYYDDAVQSKAKNPAAIAWFRFKLKYVKVGDRWRRKVKKDQPELMKVIETDDGLFLERISIDDDSHENHTFEKYISIRKADEEKHIVYGIALEPDVVDAQGDIVSVEDIEKAAHDFLIASRKIDEMHTRISDKCYPVESYLAPVDFEMGGQKVRKGSWILGVKVNDEDIWKKIKNGEYRGFSITGWGVRTPVEEVSE